MKSVIQLLPENISNQIAAGEVIQRPASAVKELVENSIDAGATDISVIIKDAGKQLIQVIDNGIGMTDIDARICFEKHATSKIKNFDDLYIIKTKGFRGEALASIAAVAQVEMKTRHKGSQVGTQVKVENSIVLSQEEVSTPEGTNLMARNLFYNVPARRNFLKSNQVEMKHIMEEVNRIALSHPMIRFRVYSNDSEIAHYKEGNIRQRIVSVMGEQINAGLVPLEEKSDYIHVHGFIGKPDFSRKTRGEQYLFVNNRFIKSSYINHAVMQAYKDILPADHFPFYAIFIDIDTSMVDVNVHPSKQEVKFEDERLVYTFVNAGVRHSLGMYNISPSLDFNQDVSVVNWDAFKEPKSFNPGNSGFISNHHNAIRNKQQEWQQLYEIAAQISDEEDETDNDSAGNEVSAEGRAPVQLNKRYILSQVRSGIVLIDQSYAHERILYEKYKHAIINGNLGVQKQLFPVSIELNNADSDLLQELVADISHLGFDVQYFGSNTFVIHGMPADLPGIPEKQLLEELLEQYKNSGTISGLNRQERLARAMAKSTCIKSGKVMDDIEMRSLTDELFSCENPYHTPGGKSTLIKIDWDEISGRFNQ